MESLWKMWQQFKKKGEIKQTEEAESVAYLNSTWSQYKWNLSPYILAVKRCLIHLNKRHEKICRQSLRPKKSTTGSKTEIQKWAPS